MPATNRLELSNLDNAVDANRPGSLMRMYGRGHRLSGSGLFG